MAIYSYEVEDGRYKIYRDMELVERYGGSVPVESRILELSDLTTDVLVDDLGSGFEPVSLLDKAVRLVRSNQQFLNGTCNCSTCILTKLIKSRLPEHLRPV